MDKFNHRLILTLSLMGLSFQKRHFYILSFIFFIPLFSCQYQEKAQPEKTQLAQPKGDSSTKREKKSNRSSEPNLLPSTSTQNDSETPTIHIRKDGLIKVLLSKNKLIKTNELQTEISLKPLLTSNHSFDYSLETHEGILQFQLKFTELSPALHISEHPSFYTHSSAYLFTRMDQNHLKNKYDTEEALIYLKMDQQEIPVGKYQKSSSGDEESTWSHPFLCEKEFAKTCSIFFKPVFKTENEKEKLDFGILYFRLQDNSPFELGRTSIQSLHDSTHPFLENYQSGR